MINDRGQIVIIDFGRGTKKLPNPAEIWEPKPDTLFTQTVSTIASTTHGHMSAEVRKTNHQLFGKILPMVESLEIPFPIALQEMSAFVNDLDFSGVDNEVLDLLVPARYSNDERVPVGKMRALLYFARCGSEKRQEIENKVKSWNGNTFEGVSVEKVDESKKEFLKILGRFGE